MRLGAPRGDAAQSVPDDLIEDPRDMDLNPILMPAWANPGYLDRVIDGIDRSSSFNYAGARYCPDCGVWYDRNEETCWNCG